MQTKKHLSQLELEKVYKSELKTLGHSGIEGIRRFHKEHSHRENNTTIFLCHSHLDKTIVNKVLMLFNSLNIRLYVDWMDTSMPAETDRNTGSLIKQKIEQSDKFLFLATYNALRSKWCNWELGLAYSAKGEHDFAILPIESKSGNWSGNEYLALYPEMRINSIERIETLKTEDIEISYYDRKKVSFREWLNKKTAKLGSFQF